jgi:hypothetical protein
MEPLNFVRRNVTDIISEYQLPRNGKNTAKMLKEWKNKFSIRPIWNCMWNRKCIPTNPYKIITTDILHEIVHGILDYLITNMVELFKRNKLNTQVITMMRRIIKKFRYFSSPSFTTKNNVVVVDPTKLIRLRALDIALDRSEVKIKSSDSVFAWLHACLIVVGYGDNCPLSQEGNNELHHYRMIMNLVTRLLIELETETIDVEQEWINKVDTIVEGIILLLQDPHMYMKHGTEKMHRLRHLTENYCLHGSFKNSNTSHWERAHSFFTKFAFENVGRHGREHSELPPKAKMLLEVYSVFLATYRMKQGAKYRSDDVEPEDNDYQIAGVAYVLSEINVSDLVNKWYRVALASWKKYVKEKKNKRKAEQVDEEEPPEYTLPPELKNVRFYAQVQKSFAMSTTVPIPSKDVCLADGRRSQKYYIGSCVVLESAPDDVPSFAIIDGIVKTETKIFLLLEYIYSSKTINTVSKTQRTNLLTYFP